VVEFELEKTSDRVEKRPGGGEALCIVRYALLRPMKLMGGKMISGITKQVVGTYSESESNHWQFLPGPLFLVSNHMAKLHKPSW
jgi:hypothetical protein